MTRKIIIALFFQIFQADFSHACDNFRSVIESKIFPNGGSIESTLETRCKSKVTLSYTVSLKNERKLLISGREISSGSFEESLLPMEIDQLIQKKTGRKSVKDVQHAEMRRFAKGATNTLTPIFALI